MELTGSSNKTLVTIFQINMVAYPKSLAHLHQTILNFS